MIKYFNPLLPHWLHSRVSQQVLDPIIGWKFVGSDSNNENSYFTRIIFDKQTSITNYNNVDSLTYALNYWIDNNSSWFTFKELHRCDLHLFAATQHINWHTDCVESQLYNLIYYVNDASGGNECENDRIIHKENTAILIPANQMRRTIISTEPRRVTVTWTIEGSVNV